jgi:hypothetical protein
MTGAATAGDERRGSNDKSSDKHEFANVDSWHGVMILDGDWSQYAKRTHEAVHGALPYKTS